jgi:putative PIN family toxin of toxin-antitoxin system
LGAACVIPSFAAGVCSRVRQINENGIISYVISKLALDTDVVVAAMRSPRGASAAVLLAARRGRVKLVLSVALALEYEAVCRRAEHRQEAGLSEAEVDAFINAVIALAEPVETHFLWRPQLRDPGDEMVLEAAINGRADALVTFNKRDYANVPSRFGIEVLLPREALGRISA